jgi:hypothetical protein
MFNTPIMMFSCSRKMQIAILTLATFMALC